MNVESAIFFSGWLAIERVLVIGAVGYLFLIFALRIVGPRTLAKTNLFDFVILVSIGSVYGRILTAEDVALAEACVAYALVVFMHYAVSWLRTRSARVSSLLDAEPILLFYRGTHISGALKRARVKLADIEAAVREKGLGSMRMVEAVVLEANGELSIIGSGPHDQELVANVGRRSHTI